MNRQAGTEYSLALSYLGLRKAVGWIGLLLPFALALGNIIIFRQSGIQGSISSYYYTDMRNVFVGSLCATGGCVMVPCIAIMAVVEMTGLAYFQDIKAVFWLETTALVSFDISWLVKGDTILKDKPEKTAQV